MSQLLDDVLKALSPTQDGGWRLEDAGRLSNLLESRLSDSRAPGLVLRPVLKLIAVLQDDPRSVGAAEALIRVLRQSPVAYRALQRSRLGAAGGRKASAQLSAFEGRRSKPRAAIHDGRAPLGSLPGWRLMRPLDPAAKKVKRR